MSNHKPTYSGYSPHLKVTCSCKHSSPIGSKADVDEWHLRHLQEIERIRTHLDNRNPSIKKTWEWYDAQAENEDNSPEDRVLWRRLADELRPRVPVKGDLGDAETLF